MRNVPAFFLLCLTALAAACSGLPSGGAPSAGIAGAGGMEQAAGQASERSREEKTAPDLVRLATEVEARGDRASALQFYERATALSDDAATRVKLGDAYMRAGRINDAISAYQDAVAKAPEDGKVLLGLGSALVKAGKLAEGHAALAKAAPIVGTATAYDRLGVARILLGQPGEALAAFEEAYGLDKGDPDIAANLALASALDGQHDRAIGLMRQVMASSGAKSHHRRNLVLVLGIAGKASEAEAAASKDLGAADIRAILARAENIRGLSSARARALALGMAKTGG